MYHGRDKFRECVSRGVLDRSLYLYKVILRNKTCEFTTLTNSYIIYTYDTILNKFKKAPIYKTTLKTTLHTPLALARGGSLIFHDEAKNIKDKMRYSNLTNNMI